MKVSVVRWVPGGSKAVADEGAVHLACTGSIEVTCGCVQLEVNLDGVDGWVMHVSGLTVACSHVLIPCWKATNWSLLHQSCG